MARSKNPVSQRSPWLPDKRNRCWLLGWPRVKIPLRFGSLALAGRLAQISNNIVSMVSCQPVSTPYNQQPPDLTSSCLVCRFPVTSNRSLKSPASRGSSQPCTLPQPDRRYQPPSRCAAQTARLTFQAKRSEEHTSELQSRLDIVCR